MTQQYMKNSKINVTQGKKTVEKFARKTQGKYLLKNGCDILGMIKIEYVQSFTFIRMN